MKAKKIVAFLISAVMAAQSMPVYAFTAEKDTSSAEQNMDNPAAVLSGEDILPSLCANTVVSEDFEYIVNADGITVTISKYTGAGGSVVIPTEISGYPVTVIGGNAFSGCTSVTSVSLPEGLQTIQAFAFQNCSALETIDIPDSVTTISSRAFYQCTNLSYVGYPAGWTSTPDIYNSLKNADGDAYYKSPFDGCTKLKKITVDLGVTAIPKHAFRGMTSLEEIVLPPALTKIGGYAFESCIGLKEIAFPSSLLEIGESAFWKCSGLTSLIIPEEINVISRRAFSGCTGLTSVSFPDGLQTIQSFAFQNCSALETIDIPDSVTTISSRAFYQCTSLNEVGYPAGWTSTPDIYNELADTDDSYYYMSPFDGCTDLKTITVDDGVTVIPNHAFSGMTYLEWIDLPYSLTTINEYAFEECTGLELIVLPPQLNAIGASAFRNCSEISYIELPDSLESIGSNAFASCSSLHMIEIPDKVRVLNDAAFSNCSNLTYIMLPATLEEIGQYVFNKCSALDTLIVPDSVERIADNAFFGAVNVSFYCNLVSYAAVYAIEHGIAVIDLEKNHNAADLMVDRADSYYKVNFDGISASGYLVMTAKYAFRTPDNISDVTINFNIPSSASLAENMITVNGRVCTDYTYENGMLTIPCSSEGGTIRFSLKPLDYSRITTYAIAAFQKDSAVYTEVFGSVCADLPVISISCRNETAADEVTVTGSAVPGNSVDLYVNGVKKAIVTANKAGFYSATLPLGELSDGKIYDLCAETTYNGIKLTDETTTVYRDAVPMLTQFIMEHNGQKFRMNENSVNKPIVFFRPGRTFKFAVKFDHSESVSRVFIVSSHNNVKKYMEAEWNDTVKAYIAEGYFDPENTSYVPGTISVEYVQDDGLVSFEEGYDFTAEESINEVPDEWKNADIVVNENTDTVTDITITLQNNVGQINMRSRQIAAPEGITESNAQANGYTKITDDYGNDAYVRYYERKNDDICEIVQEILVFGIDEFVTIAVEHSVSASMGSTAGKNFGGLWGSTFAAAEMLGAYKQGSVFGDDYSAMKYAIETSSLSQEEKEAMRKLLDDAIVYNTWTTALRWAGTLAAASVGVTMGPIPGFVVGVGVKLLDIFYDHTQRELSYQMYMLMKALGITGFGFRWAIDPSGYVYDETNEERLSGVMATVNWIPYDENDSEFWNKKPDDREFGSEWDASEFSQSNPLKTDADGRYAWDVPQGWWRVRFEKTGYETEWSEWLAVPPPQTEVNIAMTPCDESIIGTVTAWNSERDIILALYPSETADDVISSDIILDEPTRAVTMITAACIEETDIPGRCTESYSFHSVETGSYKLAVYKPGIRSVVIRTIVIDENVQTIDNIDLWLLGDLNTDGNVSSEDSELFGHCFAGWDTEDAVFTPDTADVNGDCTVTRADAMILARYLAEWEGYTLPYSGE